MAHLDTVIKWKPGEDPPKRDSTSPAFKGFLERLLVVSTPGVGKNFECTESKDILNWIRFCTGDVTGDSIDHNCPGCCTSQADSVRNGMRLCRDACY